MLDLKNQFYHNFSLKTTVSYHQFVLCYFQTNFNFFDKSLATLKMNKYTVMLNKIKQSAPFPLKPS